MRFRRYFCRYDPKWEKLLTCVRELNTRNGRFAMKTKNKKLYRVIQASQCFDSLPFPAAFKMVVYGLGRGDDDRMFVLYAPRTANNKPREVITRRDFAQIGRVINSCGQSALPPPSTAKLSRRPEPSRFPLFVAALCGFVARTNHGKDILIPKRRRSGLERLLIRVSRVRAPTEPEIPMTNNGCDGDRSSTMLVKTTPLLSPSRSSFRSGRHSNWRTERGGDKKKREARFHVRVVACELFLAVPLRSSSLYSTCFSRYTHVCKRTRAHHALPLSRNGHRRTIPPVSETSIGTKLDWFFTDVFRGEATFFGQNDTKTRKRFYPRHKTNVSLLLSIIWKPLCLPTAFQIFQFPIITGIA